MVDRYKRLCEQRAYERRIRAFGLPAIIAPYKAGGRLVVMAGQAAPERPVLRRAS